MFHTPPPSNQLSKPQLQHPEGDIAQRRRDERELEADIARRARDRADKPHLVHRRHDQADREHARADGGEPEREAAGVVPAAEVVRRKRAAADREVLRDHDRAERARPVADQPEEVAQRVVELVLADDRERDDAARGQMGAWKRREGGAYMAVASTEKK